MDLMHQLMRLGTQLIDVCQIDFYPFYIDGLMKVLFDTTVFVGCWLLGGLMLICMLRCNGRCK